MTPRRALQRHFILIGLVLGAAGVACAGPAQFGLTERITIGRDGSAEVRLTVVPSAAGTGPLVIPFIHGTPSQVMAGDSTVAASPGTVHGRPAVVLAGELIPGRSYTIDVRCDTLAGWSGLKSGEYGNRTVRHVFTNTVPVHIAPYLGIVLLPEDMVVTSVVSSLPAQTEKDPVAPFAILAADGRSGVSIRHPGLAIGDAAQITFRCKPADKSPVLLILFGAAGILYLIFFRDVLKDNGNGSPAA